MILEYQKTKTDVRNWIYRNARAIDFTRWMYHFENGCPEAVLSTLTKYQNKDGGFGHGLEPDGWNPNSSPIQTNTAAEILYEIEFRDGDHPIISGILHYLDVNSDFNGTEWSNTIPSNNDYSDAPATALAGFGLYFADSPSELYFKCARIAQGAFHFIMQDDFPLNIPLITCYIRLLEYCKSAGIYNIIDLPVLQERLQQLVAILLASDKQKRITDVICKPSQFFNSPNSIFWKENQDIALYECELLVQSRNEEGVWDPSRTRKEGLDARKDENNWRRGDLAIRNMLYLKNFLPLCNV